MLSLAFLTAIGGTDVISNIAYNIRDIDVISSNAYSTKDIDVISSIAYSKIF